MNRLLGPWPLGRFNAKLQSGAGSSLKTVVRRVYGSWAMCMVLRPRALPVNRLFGPWPLGRFNAKLQSGAGSSLKTVVRTVLERVRKFRGVLFSRQRPDGEARRRRISSLDLRLRSNEARRPLARKPSGRRVFCPWPALARSLQPALGMLGPRRLGHSQNPSPQDPAQFSDTLLDPGPQLPSRARSRSPNPVRRSPRTQAQSFASRSARETS